MKIFAAGFRKETAIREGERLFLDHGKAMDHAQTIALRRDTDIVDVSAGECPGMFQYSFAYIHAREVIE